MPGGDALPPGAPPRGRIDDSAPTETATPVAEAGRPRLEPGDVLAGRYRVGALLGRGGMGEIYAARDLELEENVALKLLRRELSADAAYRKRLRDEVRLARRVSHPNVCRVHDLGQHGEQVFVTMARISGRSLRQVQRAVRAGELAAPGLATIVDWISQLCAALTAAHAAGIVHRDVKPDNLLLDDGRVVLTDFGVASGAGDVDGTVVGTPAYTAPELLRGGTVDGRADVYSAAVVAYELIAGAVPFEVHSMRQAAQLARDRDPPPPLPPESAPGARRQELERVLHAGLASEPAARLPTPAALAEGLAGALRLPAGDAEGSPAAAAGSVARATAAAPAEAATVGAGHRRAEARVASVLTFAAGDATSIRASTHDPDVTPDHRASDELERTIVDLGGWPIATGAGTITALFGVPTALGDDAVRAVRAAERLVARDRDGRAGVDTRRIMVRPDRDLGARLPSARDVARQADALALAAPRGEVWLSAPAARQVAGHYDVAAAGDVGGERALRVAGEARITGGAGGGLARARELARLVALARACFETRTPRAVEVHGAHGLGKSRLRAAFMAQVAERREVEWLVACAAPLGEAAPLSLVAAADPAWFEAASRAEGGRAATLAAARRWLEERATRRPVVVLFDDLQWADEMSRALLAELAANLEALPVLLVVFGRDPVGLPGAEAIELGPLDDATALALARELAPAAGDDALAGVVGRAGGNPFFVEELARELSERGDRPGALPATVEAVLQARLERLSPVAASLLGAAAVVGRTFWREAARAALPAPIDDATLDAGLAELERRALAFPTPAAGLDDDRYELAHALIRDVAYQRLPPRERRAAHGAVARWLGAQLGGPARSTPASTTTTAHPATDPDLLWALAHHRDLAGDAAGAGPAWRAAGLRALELFAYRQAYGALRRAWELAAGRGDAELAERLGEAAYEADTLDAAEDAFADAAALTPPEDDEAQARLAYRRGKVASAQADHAAAIAHYQRGLDLVAPGGVLTPAARRDPRLAALLFGWMGWVRSYQLGSDDPAALASCERAVELLEDTPHRRELAHALSRLGGAYHRAGRWLDQRRCNQRNLEIALALGDLSAQITAHINLGFVLGNLGALAEAIEHTEQALALCRRTGARSTTGLALSNLAGYHLERGDLDTASGLLAEGVRVLEAAGQRRILPESYQFAARIAARRGDLDDAHHAIGRSIALARASDNAADVAIGLRIDAQLAARAGRIADAEAALAEATRLSAGADRHERARLAAATARVHEHAGRHADAAAARAEARAVLAQLGAAVDLAAQDDPLDVR